MERQPVHLEFMHLTVQAPTFIGEHNLPTMANSIRHGLKVDPSPLFGDIAYAQLDHVGIALKQLF
jgi:hypothetical protein